jgi:hypothetical protein
MKLSPSKRACQSPVTAAGKPSFTGMQMPAGDSTAARKHERYRAFGCQTLAEADAEPRSHWLARTPEERLEALEELRVRIYGEEKVNARIPRVFGVPEPRGS